MKIGFKRKRCQDDIEGTTIKIIESGVERTYVHKPFGIYKSDGYANDRLLYKGRKGGIFYLGMIRLKNFQNPVDTFKFINIKV